MVLEGSGPWWRRQGRGFCGVDGLRALVALMRLINLKILILISDDEVRDEVGGYRIRILAHGDANY